MVVRSPSPSPSYSLSLSPSPSPSPSPSCSSQSDAASRGLRPVPAVKPLLAHRNRAEVGNPLASKSSMGKGERRRDDFDDDDFDDDEASSSTSTAPPPLLSSSAARAGAADVNDETLLLSSSPVDIAPPNATRPLPAPPSRIVRLLVVIPLLPAVLLDTTPLAPKLFGILVIFFRRPLLASSDGTSDDARSPRGNKHPVVMTPLLQILHTHAVRTTTTTTGACGGAQKESDVLVLSPSPEELFFSFFFPRERKRNGMAKEKQVHIDRALVNGGEFKAKT